MKILAASGSIAGFFVFAPASMASPPTQAHSRSYLRAYDAVRKLDGPRAPGCKLLGARRSCHVRATDARVTASLSVLERMVAPPSTSAAPASSTTSRSTPSAVSVAPASSLAGCIISRESGGNTQAVNGQYTGIAQWSPASWAGGGGTRYASSPLGATYSQQVAVLDSMLAAGQAGQWTPYDGC